MTSQTTPQNPRVKPVYDDQNELDPVLYDNEDPANYRAFKDQMFEALGPQDEVERLLVRSIVDYHWDARRDRRLLPRYVAACEPEGLRAILVTLRLPAVDVDRLVAAFAAGDDRAEVAAVLSAAGHDLDTARAKTVALNLNAVGKLEALIIAKEKRRDRCLRDLAHRQRARQEAKNADGGPK